MLRNLLMISAAAVAVVSAPAAAVTLNAGITGNIVQNSPNPPFPVPGSTFTLTGGFSSYSQTGGLPDITLGDLNQYSFTATGTAQSFNQGTRTTTYTGVTGEIRYSNGQLVQGFVAPSGLTITFRDDSGEVGDVFGFLNSTGPVNFGPNPPVDFSAANGASFQGVYTRTNAQTAAGTFTGSLVFPAVPEPGTWAMMIGGFGLVGGALRRQRATLATA